MAISEERFNGRFYRDAKTSAGAGSTGIVISHNQSFKAELGSRIIKTGFAVI
jgi:3-hydroxy-3-methylglutaryl CoA synthase